MTHSQCSGPGGARARGGRLGGALLGVVLLFAAATPVNACSTFYIIDDKIFGKNYDWSVDAGLLVVNKRGVIKTALSGRHPAMWTSRYGSITFNQYGRELPSGGINEAGLVIELMWLDDTEYPRADARPGVGNLQWIQYQMDNSADVDEVIASDKAIRVESGGSSKVHYLVADAAGRCATIEFIDGRLACHTRGDLPWPVLTNDTYASSLEYLGGFEGFGGGRPIVQSSSSLGRFVNAVGMIDRFDPVGGTSSVDYAFEILGHVAQGQYTKWSIVYDIASRTIHFRTFASTERRYVRVDGFDFECDTPVRILDVNAPLSGDVTDRFTSYNYDANRKLIEQSFDGTSFLRSVPHDARNRLAQYPATHKCEVAE